MDQTGQATSKTVLIADDQPSMRILISAALALGNLQVIQASDGDEAWRLIRQHRPDLAVLDVQMPGRTGLELARAIRDDNDLAGTRIILLTATALESDMAAGLNAGADHYITKPFSPLDFLEEVQRTLQVNRSAGACTFTARPANGVSGIDD